MLGAASQWSTKARSSCCALLKVPSLYGTIQRVNILSAELDSLGAAEMFKHKSLFALSSSPFYASFDSALVSAGSTPEPPLKSKWPWERHGKGLDPHCAVAASALAWWATGLKTTTCLSWIKGAALSVPTVTWSKLWFTQSEETPIALNKFV